MELCGNVAEQRGLTGRENLKKLLAAFTEGDAALAKNVLPGMEDDFRKNVAKNQAQIRKGLQELVCSVPLPSQEKDVESAVKSLASEYISLEFGLSYHRISPELFRLRRKINYEHKALNDDEELELAIPLFANITLGECRWELNNLNSYLNEKQKDILRKHRIENIRFAARAPPIPKEVKQLAKKASADYMEICSKALREPVIGDILLRDIETGKARQDLQVYWIPAFEDLEIEVEKEKDPFLVSKIYDIHFLVARWDILGEEPYEHYLQEFTSKRISRS